jgi:hypothetical protein
MVAKTKESWFVLIPFYTILVGCGSPLEHKKVYEVDSELEPYVALFEQRAFEQQFSITIDDIKISFVDDLGEDEDSVTLGMCYTYSGEVDFTPVIEIDRGEFYDLDPLEREALMFHELGHCVLDRPHTDDRAANSRRPASLMSTSLTMRSTFMSCFISKHKIIPYVAAISLVSASCGEIKHDVEVQGKTEVEFNFNFEEIMQYYIIYCQSISDPSPLECAQIKTAEFLEMLKKLSGSG